MALVARAVVLSGLAACIPFEPGSDELPDLTTQTLGESPERGHDWSCLRQDERQSVLVASPVGATRLVQSLQVLSLATGEVPPDVFVRACPVRDIDCTLPLTDNLPVDAEGWVDLPLYEGFDGFLEITGDAVVPTLLFYADALSPASQVDRTPLGLVEKNLLPSLSVAAGSEQRDTLGLVYLRAFDCGGVAAPGVTFTMDREGWRWYFVDGLPSSTAAATVESGLGGFLNVEPGIAVVNAELPGAVRPIAAPKSVIVRAGWMTGLRWIPLPEPE